MFLLIKTYYVVRASPSLIKEYSLMKMSAGKRWGRQLFRTSAKSGHGALHFESAKQILRCCTGSQRTASSPSPCGTTAAQVLVSVRLKHCRSRAVAAQLEEEMRFGPRSPDIFSKMCSLQSYILSSDLAGGDSQDVLPKNAVAGNGLVSLVQLDGRCPHRSAHAVSGIQEACVR